MCEVVGDLYGKDCFEAEMPVDEIENFIGHLESIPTMTNIRIGNPDYGHSAPVELNIRVWCKGYNHYHSALEKAKGMGAEILEETRYTCVKLKTKWLDKMIKWIDDYNLNKENLKHILCIRDCEEGVDDVFEVYSERKEHVEDLLENFDLKCEDAEECMSIQCGGKYKGLGTLRKFILDNTENKEEHSDLKDLNADSEKLDELHHFSRMSVYEHVRSGDRYIVYPPDDTDHVYPNDIVKRINAYDEIDEELIDHLKEWVQETFINDEKKVEVPRRS